MPLVKISLEKDGPFTRQKQQKSKAHRNHQILLFALPQMIIQR